MTLNRSLSREVTTNIATSYEAGTSEEDKFIRWDEKFRNKEPVSAIIGMNQCLPQRTASLGDVVSGVLRSYRKCAGGRFGSWKHPDYDSVEIRARS